MIKSLLQTIAITGTIALIALSTHAETPACPENSAQTTQQIIQHFRTTPKLDNQYIAVAGGLQQACKDDYITNLGLAEAWASLAARENGLNLEQRFNSAKRAMDLLLHVNSLPLVAHNYRRAGETRSKTVIQLVSIADAGGPKVEWLDGETPFPLCERGFANPAQKLWNQYKRDQNSKHTPILLKAQADACMTERMQDPLKYLAEYKVDLAGRTEDPVEAFGYMKEAKALYDIYGGDDHSNLGWNPELRGFFDVKYIKVGLSGMTASDAMPKESLFKAETLNTTDQKLSLFWHIDQAWGPVPKSIETPQDQEAYTAQLKTYMLAIHELVTLARAESREAEFAVFYALRDHAEKGIRSARTLDAADPPEFTRTIYDPRKSQE